MLTSETKASKAQWKWVIGTVVLLLVCMAGIFIARWALDPASRFGFRTLRSAVDADGDGLDDYTDIMRGARAYIQTTPEYSARYYAGGYPPDGVGVCADVIWRAFDAAGYDLKGLIDEDIRQNLKLYPRVRNSGGIDSDIDFRRVANLNVFFSRFAETLTVDVEQIDQWQQGDIVVYDGHIAILSDRRNELGLPYIIHHAGAGPAEEDGLTSRPILAHYRWNMSLTQSNSEEEKEDA